MVVSVNSLGLCDRLQSLVLAKMIDPAARVMWKTNFYVKKEWNELFTNDISIGETKSDDRLIDINNYGDRHLVDIIKRPHRDHGTIVSDTVKRIVRSLEIQSEIIDGVLPDISSDIAVHIRTWKEVPGLKKRFKLDHYTRAIDKLGSLGTIFVTSDDINQCYQMQDIYGDRVFMNDTTTGHYAFSNHMQSVKALQDLYISSMCDYIVGDKRSAYTQYACWMMKETQVLYIDND